MLVGDSVLLQEKRKICRPSDLGKPVEIADTWTLRFNNGVRITTTESTYFKTCQRGHMAEEWVSLSNLSRFTKFGNKEPFKYANKKWDSIVELSDYTSKSGEFDLNNLDFAKFVGAFLKGAKIKSARPDAYCINRDKFSSNIDYVKTLYPSGAVDLKKKEVFLKKCWVDELVDAIFNFTELASIPDDLIFTLPEEWVNAFSEGFLSMSYYDSNKKCYAIELRLDQFIADYGMLMTRLNRGFQVYTNQTTYNSEFLLIKFLDISPPLLIIDGYENKVPKVLYDVGDGEFNASGIWIKS